jgi:hypothetical protein
VCDKCISNQIITLWDKLYRIYNDVCYNHR